MKATDVGVPSVGGGRGSLFFFFKIPTLDYNWEPVRAKKWVYDVIISPSEAVPSWVREGGRKKKGQLAEMARPKGKDFFPHLGIWRRMMTTVKLDRGWIQPRIISARMLSDTLFTQLWGVKLESSDLSASERAVGSIWCFLCWMLQRHEKWEQPGRRCTTWRLLSESSDWVLFGKWNAECGRKGWFSGCQLHLLDELWCL